MADELSRAELHALHGGGDTIEEDAGSNHRGGSGAKGWPKLPEHDASLAVIRGYLTEAARLPPGWQVDLAERHGRYGSDPLTITIRTPGAGSNIDVRFDAQRECSKPSVLRGAFMEATNGLSRMKYPKPVEASDFYAMVCALASIGSTATIADETEQWLHEYLGKAWVIDGLSLRPPHTYDTMQELRKRPEFDRRQANRYLRGDLDEMDHWVALIDSQTEELWIRVGELASYLRHVYGERIAQHALDARIVEYGGERERLDQDRRRAGGEHMTLTFYRFPTAQSFPTVLRMQPTPSVATRARTP